MGDVGKAYDLADFGDTLIGFLKQSLGVNDPEIIDILDNSSVSMFFEFTAEIIGTQIKMS